MFKREVRKCQQGFERGFVAVAMPFMTGQRGQPGRQVRSRLAWLSYEGLSRA